MAKCVQFPCGYDPLDELMAEVNRKWPKVKVYYKNSSAFMKFLYVISFMWIWQRNFFNFHTTIGYKIYLVDKTVNNGYWRSLYGTIRHELVHVFQYMKWWFFYYIGYLFPQVLALGAISAIWGPCWMLFFLVFLAPLPAPWRTKWELEGYTETLLTHYEIHGELPDWFIEQKARNFYTAAYYFMWPFKADVFKRLNRIKNRIRMGTMKSIYLEINP